MTEGNTIFKSLIYQKRFTYSSTTIYRNKLRQAAIIQLVELLYFLLSSNDILHKKAFYSAANLQKHSFTAK